MGQSFANRLWQRHGIEFLMLAVRSMQITKLLIISTYKSRRICLERLGVVQESDHAALVIRVFWRCVPQMTAFALIEPLILGSI